MTAPNYTDDELVEAWNKLGSATLVAKHLNTHKTGVLGRRRAVEKRRGIELKAWNSQRPEAVKSRKPGRIEAKLYDGICIIFSDAHYQPNNISTAHKALLRFIKELHPQIIINNGDAADFSTISKHQRIGWDNSPTVAEEIKEVQDRLGEIENISKGILIWCLGNHDARLETAISNVLPQLEKLHGTSLKDHFPRWQPCWSVFINDDVVVKHRYKSGIHATHNNTVTSGRTLCTGHLHSLKVTPYTDYNGTRYGVDCGTLACPTDAQFSGYLENNPTNWRSGFVVLTFKEGKLLPPELVQVWGDEDDSQVTFRGAIIPV